MLNTPSQGEVLGQEEAGSLLQLPQTARMQCDLIPFLLWALWVPMEEQQSLTFMEPHYVPLLSTFYVLSHYVDALIF